MNNKNYSIELIVREDNNRAKRVYKKLNFVQKRIIPNHFKNINVNGLLYSLRLNNK
jgi:ribosomal protein S18 acetylase RimI-like enzyme